VFILKVDEVVCFDTVLQVLMVLGLESGLTAGIALSSDRPYAVVEPA
jgi:hypothetical protein